MSMAAAASYRTVPNGLVLGNLNAHFLLGSKPDVPYLYKVQRLSSGKRFSVRVVTVEQAGKAITTITLSFVAKVLTKGRAMTHASSRSSTQNMTDVTRDDLVPKNQWGPWMKFQRLTPEPKGPSYKIISLISDTFSLTQFFIVSLTETDAIPPDHKIAPAVAKIWSPITSDSGSTEHILGLVNLSDYHVLDSPLTLHGITFGLPEIGSEAEERSPGNRETTKKNVVMNTSLNHAIHFHVHDGFRADELTYIEVTSPWARDGRARMHSRIFSKDGLLIATCEQQV